MLLLLLVLSLSRGNSDAVLFEGIDRMDKFLSTFNKLACAAGFYALYLWSMSAGGVNCNMQSRRKEQKVVWALFVSTPEMV